MVKLSKKQLEESIFFHLREKQGLNDILKMMFESLTMLEQNAVISKDLYAKGNGYRFRQEVVHKKVCF